MTVPVVKLTKADRDKLASVVVTALGAERPSSAVSMLLGEICRATVIDSDSLLPDVVAPHRDIEIHDNITNTKRRLQLVYPGESETDRDGILGAHLAPH